MIGEKRTSLTCGACKHTGTDFIKVDLVLNESTVIIQAAENDSVATDKALSMFVCPECGTAKVYNLKHP
jgi:hypothetical protein